MLVHYVKSLWWCLYVMQKLLWWCLYIMYKLYGGTCVLYRNTMVVLLHDLELDDGTLTCSNSMEIFVHFIGALWPSFYGRGWTNPFLLLLLPVGSLKNLLRRCHTTSQTLSNHIRPVNCKYKSYQTSKL